MPVIIPVSGGSSSGSTSTTAASTVISKVQLDLQTRLPYDTTTLLDYLNRVQLDILKVSRWKFLLSAPQHFITELGQTNYWIGTTGNSTTGTVDTALNLSDLEFIKEGSVFDRSNFRELNKTDEQPLMARLGFADETSRPGRPAVWRNAVDTPYVMNLYPAPDNQNTYQPVPTPPYATTASGGALAQRSYYLRITYVDSAGNEGSASSESNFLVPASYLLTVKSPAAEPMKAASGVSYNKYNVYASTTPGAETLQNVSPIAIGTDWTESNTGLTTSGAGYPTQNNLTQMGGYLIEFRYFKQRQIVTDTATIVQVPDMYIPVLVHGIDALLATVLGRQDMAIWQQMYKEGLISIIRDKNLFPKGDSFIGPDSASVTRQLFTIESFDLSRFQL